MRLRLQFVLLFHHLRLPLGSRPERLIVNRPLLYPVDLVHIPNAVTAANVRMHADDLHLSMLGGGDPSGRGLEAGQREVVAYFIGRSHMNHALGGLRTQIELEFVKDQSREQSGASEC